MPIIVLGIIAAGTAWFGINLASGMDPAEALWGVITGVMTPFFAVADWIVGLLPGATDLGLEIPAGFLIVYDYMDRIVPLHEALFFIGAFLLVNAAIFLYRLADKVWHTIPKPFMGT